ncbi:MAG TPA: YvcK family protein [Candidatus Paceibacterota bacterium]|nr:YvcK family protein [Candidatus Pacearchaeota archaeon]HRZ50729.1 YvcK family protein [Candidatus Paceibacterota bacterium]HSA36374.1 YvcK family protein [Candidatus Paceibacterota bacterium]
MAAKRKSQANKQETVVCFGGGNGITKYLIGPLKKDYRIVAATSMVDSGMSAGQLRQDLGVLPPGDLVKQLAAVSDAREWKVKLWKKRFGREQFLAGHVGHTFGNLYLAGIEHITGSFAKALSEAEIFLELGRHRAYPATTDNVQLCAELENGEVIVGEDEIDEPAKHDPGLKIKRVFLEPEAKAFKPLLKEIAAAKAVIFGPSDFYSSLVPCLLPAGISKALAKTSAKKIFIANTVTESGETGGFSIEDFVSVLEKYMGCPLDHIIMQYPPVSEESVLRWKKNYPSIMETVAGRVGLDGRKFIKTDIMMPDGEFGYDPKKIKKAIIRLINNRKKKKQKF